MAQQSYSVTENEYSSYKSTWTVLLNGYDANVTADGQIIKLAAPTMQAKYVNSNKSYGSILVAGYLYANGITMGYFSKAKESSSGKIESAVSDICDIKRIIGNSCGNARSTHSRKVRLRICLLEYLGVGDRYRFTQYLDR